MKKLIILALVCLIFIQCQSNKEHLLQKNQVGLINPTTKVSELDFIFKNDSLVKPVYIKDEFKYINEDYEVYSKMGDHLLTINVENTSDSTAVIQSVQVFSPIYKTKNEVSLNSFYKDLADKHEVAKVESTFSSASVYVKDLNASFVISNTDLGLPEFTSRKVSLDQIPDNAKFKYITFWLN
jgi:hypothetical protein